MDRARARWTDAEYEEVLRFKPLIEFREPFIEDFSGKAAYSEKWKLNAIGLTGTIPY